MDQNPDIDLVLNEIVDAAMNNVADQIVRHDFGPMFQHAADPEHRIGFAFMDWVRTKHPDEFKAAQNQEHGARSLVRAFHNLKNQCVTAVFPLAEEASKRGVSYKAFSVENLLESLRITPHTAGIATFSVGAKNLVFLIDPTFRQFQRTDLLTAMNAEAQGVEAVVALAPADRLAIFNPPMHEALKNKGYAPLTRENAMDYLRCFMIDRPYNSINNAMALIVHNAEKPMPLFDF
jgi:hypothetical protein